MSAAAQTKIDLLSQPASWYAQQPEIERFQGFLRIPSISQSGPTDGSYHKAVAYLKSLLEPHLKCTVKEYVANKPVLVATLEGTDPSLPSILLNSHYDVVPTMREMWSDDPFSAKILETGEVLARGTQDMKCVCMQYLEAILRLKARGVKLARTVHLSYCPDEEIGGSDGMGHLIESPDWAALNVGAALDEGLANANEEKTFTVFYGERAVWWLQVRATGPTGHASRFIQNTAMEKLIRSINHFLNFRKEQEARLHAGCKHAIATKLGDVATLNLTVLQGGVSVDGGKSFATNVIPTEAMAGFDIRIPPNMPLDEFEAKVKEWTSEEGLSYKFVYKTPVHAVTSIDRATNPFWAAFEDAVTLKGKPEEKTDGFPIQTEIFPAGTDGRYVRQQNVPVFGFSPMARTPVLLHDHNERIHCGVYLQGIQVYERVIEALSNCRA